MDGYRRRMLEEKPLLLLETVGRVCYSTRIVSDPVRGAERVRTCVGGSRKGGMLTPTPPLSPHWLFDILTAPQNCSKNITDV